MESLEKVYGKDDAKIMNEDKLIDEKDEIQQPRIEQSSEEPTSPLASPATKCQEDGSSSERVPRFRSLQEIYDVTENQDNITLFCLFADCEPINFQEALQKKN